MDIWFFVRKFFLEGIENNDIIGPTSYESEDEEENPRRNSSLRASIRISEMNSRFICKITREKKSYLYHTQYHKRPKKNYRWGINLTSHTRTTDSYSLRTQSVSFTEETYSNRLRKRELEIRKSKRRRDSRTSPQWKVRYVVISDYTEAYSEGFKRLIV